jgi:cell division protein FtsL
LLQKSGTYVYGNTAEELGFEKVEYNVYEENKVLKEKKKYKSYKKTKFRTIVAILFIFSVCLLVMYRYALITELNYKFSEMEKKYNEMRKENSILEVAIENETDLSGIREIAEQKLNMQEPDSSQIVFVNVPKTDYTIVAETYKLDKRSNTRESIFTVLLEKVGRLTKMIY